MTTGKVWSALIRWFERIRVALWLHPEMDHGRRTVLFGGVALVASMALAQVPDAIPMVSGQWTDYSGAFSQELTATVRRAFMPRLYVQVWKTSPLIGALLHEA